MNPKADKPMGNAKLPLSQTDIEQLLDSIKGITHGSLTLIIQDGRVVQIDRNEKKRLV